MLGSVAAYVCIETLYRKNVSEANSKNEAVEAKQ